MGHTYGKHTQFRQMEGRWREERFLTLGRETAGTGIMEVGGLGWVTLFGRVLAQRRKVQRKAEKMLLEPPKNLTVLLWLQET